MHFLSLNIRQKRELRTLPVLNSSTTPDGYAVSAPWHGSCDSVNAGGRGAVSQRSNVCVREMTPHAYSIDQRYCNASEPPPLAGGDRRAGSWPGRVYISQGGG